MVHDHSISVVSSSMAKNHRTAFICQRTTAYFRQMTEWLLSCNRLRKSKHCSTTADLVDVILFMLLPAAVESDGDGCTHFKFHVRLHQLSSRFSYHLLAPILYHGISEPWLAGIHDDYLQHQL